MEHTFDKQVGGRRLACVLHDTKSKRIVIFCHGYRSSSIGPNRFFVRVSRQLFYLGISSLRFDQYGSGNSEGDFIESRFNDWVSATIEIANEYLARGFEVALFGQSMGGSTVIAAAANLPQIKAAVAWVPAANVHAFVWPKTGTIEEEGQVVSAKFWQQAHRARISDKLKQVKVPMYIVQCSNDEFISSDNRQAIVDSAQQDHVVEMYEGYTHSSWTYKDATQIIQRSVSFLVDTFLPKS